MAALDKLLVKYGATDIATKSPRGLARCPAIICNLLVSRGSVESDMIFNTGRTEERRQRPAPASAFGRLGRPTDIAEVVAFLVSDSASWVTGQNLGVNGGIA
jgi:NAD(P)-dependent dehydrogenase (short-subunit alcohol dehydrogenase family)